MIAPRGRSHRCPTGFLDCQSGARWQVVSTSRWAPFPPCINLVQSAKSTNPTHAYKQLIRAARIGFGSTVHNKCTIKPPVEEINLAFQTHPPCEYNSRWLTWWRAYCNSQAAKLANGHKGSSKWKQPCLYIEEMVSI